MLFSMIGCALLVLLCASVHSLSISKIQEQKQDKLLHCHCNLPQCITTGYMCKTQSGCFSDLLAYMDLNQAYHGCLDLLPKDRQRECRNVPGSESTHQGSLLLCCYEDMCNHVDSPETRIKFNETIFAVAAVLGNGSENFERATYRDQEVWFKAATIAVPICGALILLMLIALAVRILKSDSLDETVLAAKLRRKHGFTVMNGQSLVGPSRQLNPEKKLPLLFQQNDTGVRGLSGGEGLARYDKNQANAKLNSSGENSLSDYEKQRSLGGCNLLHGGVTSPLLVATTVPDKLDYKRTIPPHV